MKTIIFILTATILISCKKEEQPQLIEHKQIIDTMPTNDTIKEAEKAKINISFGNGGNVCRDKTTLTVNFEPFFSGTLKDKEELNYEIEPDGQFYIIKFETNCVASIIITLNYQNNQKIKALKCDYNKGTSFKFAINKDKIII